MGLQRISIATIGWINSSRSTEVLNVSRHLGAGQRLNGFEIQILTDHGRGIKRSQPEEVKCLVATKL